jgi:putative ABC transport system ATP-binding protein
MPAIVEMKNVVKEYPLGKLKVRALTDISLTIDTGEFTSIAGPSGSGKTTMLNLIGCVDVASSGLVKVNNENTATLSDFALTNLRLRTLGFIFQTFNLVAVLDVYQNVEFPLLLQGNMSAGERKQRVMEMIESSSSSGRASSPAASGSASPSPGRW